MSLVRIAFCNELKGKTLAPYWIDSLFSSSQTVMAAMFDSAAKSTTADGRDVEKVGADNGDNGGSPATRSSETPSMTEELQLPTSNDETESKRQVTGFRWLLVCIAIFSGNILYGLDTTIAADIQASVSSTFGNVTQLGWLGVGFTLGSTVAILPLGKAYARFDNKWVFISCLTMFAAGSALCGAAPSMNAMIVGRVWAGAGGAGIYLGQASRCTLVDSQADLGGSTLNLVTVTSSTKEQPFYVGMTGFAYGSGCILGPIVGGALADSPATWRWVKCLQWPFASL